MNSDKGVASPGVICNSNIISILWNKEPYPIKRFVGETASRTFCWSGGSKLSHIVPPKPGSQKSGKQESRKQSKGWDGMEVLGLRWETSQTRASGNSRRLGSS